jgi:hypothetical protein
MYRSQYLESYSFLGKFREPPVEGRPRHAAMATLFKNSDGGGANGSLPFFVCNDRKVEFP